MTELYGEFDIEPFEVSDRLLEDVLANPDDVEQIDGYQGHPISGLGDVYTPQPIVEFILDSVGYVPSNEIEKYPIIDLSCGTGSFVRSIVSRLKERLIKIGYEPNTDEIAQQVISTVRNNVVALDLNKMATLRTAQLVINALSDEIRNCNMNNPVGELRIYNTNSLHPGLRNQLGQFDFVVCNPPYIRNDDIESGEDKFYRDKYNTAVGKYDMYQLFIEQGIELLKPEGKLGVISPDRFHYTEYGKPLRELITKRTIVQMIVNLEGDPFPVVNAYPSISILQKKENTILDYQYDNDFSFCEVEMDELNLIHESLNNPSTSTKFCTQISQDELSVEQWSFSPPEIKNLKNKLSKEMTIFKNSRANIKTGIATGADDIFILDQADKERIESDVVYPIVRGEKVKKGEMTDFDYILNPYSREGRLIDLDKYPEAKNYLEYHKSDLKSRYCVKSAGKHWYETHDSIDTESELKNKIVTPDISSSAQFAIVEGCITHNTCYTITHPGELKVLAGFLSSSVFEFLLHSSLPEIDSGYWRQMKRDFKELPIIQIDRVPKDIAENIKSLYDSKEWSQLDEVIYDYIGLSDNERAIIEDNRP